MPEPDNPHDSNAVAVYNEDESLQAGYVPSELAEEVGTLIEEYPDHVCLSMWESRAEDERKGLRVLLAYEDVSVGIL